MREILISSGFTKRASNEQLIKSMNFFEEL